MATNVKLPKEIYYIHSVVKEIEELKSVLDGRDERINVIPAFVADAANEKRIESGRSWASKSVWNGKKYVSQKAIESGPFPNVPQSGYKIVSLEYRGNGGRAYKTVTPEGFYVDLREDVLLDCMFSKGISGGGELNDRLLWVERGSQTRLTMENSADHKLAEERTLLSKKGPLPEKELKVGTLYQNNRGVYFLYLGKARTTSVKVKYDENYNYQTRRREQINPRVSKAVLHKKPKDFWYRFERSINADDEFIMAWEPFGQTGPYYNDGWNRSRFVFGKQKVFSIVKETTKKCSIEKIRKHFLKKCQKEMLQEKKDYWLKGSDDETWQAYVLGKYDNLINLVAENEDFQVHEIYKKIWPKGKKVIWRG